MAQRKIQELANQVRQSIQVNPGTLIQNVLTNVAGLVTGVGTLVAQLFQDLNPPPPSNGPTPSSNDQQSGQQR
ncbi:hypothetical protein [Desmospora activa]|uniref:Uncharacterized protein n=1 Tax=Desmospora activa DSM 45169 TaxID=1121389 RepID=A0A2T4Z7S6_9BACL|nr:hypothetical protein [Desmospora activa]PTM57919.1 hypothetical protein C8J48_0485 [Desmospora activa DSM 45169]